MKQSRSIDQRVSGLKKSPEAGIARRLHFVLEADGRSILAFAASSVKAANAMVRRQWFREEMSRFRSAGKAVLNESDALRIRPARPDEAAQVEIGRLTDEVRGEDAKYSFAFLIPLDDDLN